jgi:23S rRNA pseudouridine2604 synthase
MATTIKLKKPAGPTTGKDAAPARAPLRGTAVRPRPTLAQAQAERAQEARRAQPTQRATPATPASVPPAQGVRLSKRMSELGLASRREADEWIERGWVRVDGKVVATLGSRVMPGQAISVTPEAQHQQAQRVTVLLNKPIGYVSGQAEDGYQPAATLVTAANHWHADRSALRFSTAHLRHLAPAGRLDIDSVGLLVLTQDGRIAKQLVGDDSKIEKEYLVRVRCADPALAEQGPPSASLPPDRLERLRHGLALDGEPLKPAKVSWQNEEQLRFVLREGKKRQIRRMCELVGLEVVGLKRVRIGRIALGDLPPGQWRYLGPFERF